jgi:hypothetical protein
LSILGVCVRDNKFYNGKGEKLWNADFVSKQN